MGNVILVVPLLLLALLTPTADPYWAISCHSFVSSVFTKISRNPFLMFLEPVTVPDVTTSTFLMKNISLYGLKTLHPQGTCLVMKAEDIINLDFGMGFKNLTYEGEYSLRLLFLWISGTVRGTIGQISAEMGVIFNETSREPKLSRFNITQLDGFEITQIDGASWMFNWVLKRMASDIALSSKASIIDSVENKTVTFTNWLFSKFTVPLMLMDALGNIVNVLP